MMAYIVSIMLDIIITVKQFFSHDVPELLALSSQALKKSKLFPTSLNDFFSYTQSDWIDVIPVFCSLLVAVLGIVLFMASLSKRNGKNPEHYRVRTYLVRCQALRYASGFLTSAIQHRSLWGKYGMFIKNRILAMCI